MVMRKIAVSTIGFSALIMALPTAAQMEHQTVLEEVIVTARKREESIMKVPVITTALSSEQLRQFETDDLAKLADQVPSLQLGEAISVFGNQISLRGIGTSTLNGTIDQSVSLNIDGMQMTQGLAYSMGLFDMAQVEVLQGPQALFFGKASPAGVISIRTADPREEFDAILRGGYEFEADGQLAELVLSGFVTDTLGLRLAGRFSDSDGYFRNRGMAADMPVFGAVGAVDPKNDHAPDTETLMLRGTALWQPNTQFTARLKVNYSEHDIKGAGWEGQYKSCPDGTDPALVFPFLGGGEDCDLDDTTRVVALDPADFSDIKNGGVPFSETDQGFGTLELNYDFGDNLTLTSVTGVYDLEQNSLINGTVTTHAGPTIAVQGDFEREDFTQEIRLTSNYDDRPLNFMVGGFYQDGSMDFLVDLPVNAVIASFVETSFGQALPPKLAYAYHDIGIDTWSAFGQLLWRVTPELELGIGARYTDEERTHKVKDLQLTLAGGSAVPVPLAVPKISSDKWSPELTLTYTPTDDLTLFASLKKAFKSGSFDTAGAAFPGDDLSFDDEQVKGGEAGIKSRLLEGTLAINAAGYFYKYDDLQVGANEFGAGGIPIIRTRNAGEAEVYGVDLDATYFVPQAEGLRLRAAVNWNVAEYNDFDNARCWGGQRIQDGCNRLFDDTTGLYTAQDLSGGKLVRAPEWSANFGVDYERPVQDLTLVIGLLATYSDEYYTNLLLRDDMLQDDYWKTNASIALRGQEDKWEVALIGTNLGDEIVSGNCVNGDFQNGQIFNSITIISGAEVRGLGGVEELQCTAERGRSLWLRLTWQY